jgi:hypothetical protein
MLPGVSRLVARVRDDTTHRLRAELEGLLSPSQRRVLDGRLEVPPGMRVSDLERWRKGRPPRGSGPAIIAALDQAAEIQGLGLASLGAESAVPPRRLGELAPVAACPQACGASVIPAFVSRSSRVFPGSSCLTAGAL